MNEADFEIIPVDEKNRPIVWDHIIQDPEFQALSQPDKVKVLQGYFTERMDTDPELKAVVARDPGIRDQIWRKMYETIAPPRPTGNEGLSALFRGRARKIVAGAATAIPFSGVEGAPTGEMPVTTPRQVAEGVLRGGVEVPLFPVRATGELAAASAGRPAAFEGYPGDVAGGETDEALQRIIQDRFQGALDKGKVALLGEEAGAGMFEEGLNIPFAAIGYVPQKLGAFIEAKTGDPLLGKTAEYASLIGMLRAAPAGARGLSRRVELATALKTRIEDLGQPYAGKSPRGQVAEALGGADADAIVREAIEEIKAPRERRKNLELRKKIDAMSPAERAEALRYDGLTGLKSRRAFEEEVDRKPVKVAIDAHGLKWINDNIGHEVGDQLLQRVADAIHESDVEGYRISGDELAILADTPDAARAAVEQIKRNLSGATLDVPLPSGRKKTFRGITISHGTGRTMKEAFAALNTDKEAAIGRGERSSERGGRPGKLVEEGRTPNPPARTGYPVPPEAEEMFAANEEGEAVKRDFLANRGAYAESEEAFDRGRAKGAETEWVAQAGIKDILKKGPGWGRRPAPAR